VGIDRPTIGDNVVLYPGAKVTGRATIGDNAVLSAMTIVHNAEVPKDTVAFMNGGELAFKPRRRDYISLYFRNSG
jgi:serine O-acetyltransferase